MSPKTSGNQSNICALAKQGNVTAIASILNYFLQEQGITTQASITNGCLKLILESAQVPNKKSLVPLVSKAINQLNIESINSVKIVGQIIGADSPRWIQFIGVNNHQVKTEPQTTESIAPSQPDSQQQNTNTNTTSEEKKLDKLIKLSQKSMWLTAIFGWTIPIATYIYTQRRVAFYIWFFVFGILAQGILSASIVSILPENTNGEDIFIKAFYLPFLVVSLASIVDNCIAIKRARKQVQLLTGKTPWQQKKNQQDKWPVWFPYPSSWLKTLFLFIWIGIIVRIFGFWGAIVGVILSAIAEDVNIFIEVIGLGLLLSIVVLSYLHHLFFGKQPFPGYPVWFPSPKSLWEGFYAPIILVLSFLMVVIILLPFVPLPNCNYQTLEGFEYCAGVAETELTNYSNSIAYFGPIIWLTVAAYFYQVEYLLWNNFSLKNVGKFILTIFIFFSLNGQVLMLLKFLGIGNNVPVTASAENKASLESELPAETSEDDSYETEYIDSESDDFQEAVNQATSAANLTQTAKTQDDWNQVKDDWQEAINLMKEIPESDPNYSVAQNRVIQYQNNFNYAQKMTEKLATQETVKYGFFKDGIKEATTAAFLVQKAKTKDEWEYITTIWEKAIEYMKAVQPSDSNYQAAQDRVRQYQQNLEYANLAASRAQ